MENDNLLSIEKDVIENSLQEQIEVKNQQELENQKKKKTKKPSVHGIKIRKLGLESQIVKWLSEGYTFQQIIDTLKKQLGINISYPTFLSWKKNIFDVDYKLKETFRTMSEENRKMLEERFKVKEEEMLKYGASLVEKTLEDIQDLYKRIDLIKSKQELHYTAANEVAINSHYARIKELKDWYQKHRENIDRKVLVEKVVSDVALIAIEVFVPYIEQSQRKAVVEIYKERIKEMVEKWIIP